MSAEKKSRKPYTAPKIEIAAQPVLNVYAAASQLSTSQSAATFLESNFNRNAASATQWASSTQWLNILKWTVGPRRRW
jgi:hypothetical protein